MNDVQELKNLTSLTELDLSDNNIATLPPELVNILLKPIRFFIKITSSNELKLYLSTLLVVATYFS